MSDRASKIAYNRKSPTRKEMYSELQRVGARISTLERRIADVRLAASEKHRMAMAVVRAQSQAVESVLHNYVNLRKENDILSRLIWDVVHKVAKDRGLPETSIDVREAVREILQ